MSIIVLNKDNREHQDDKVLEKSKLLTKIGVQQAGKTLLKN